MRASMDGIKRASGRVPRTAQRAAAAPASSAYPDLGVPIGVAQPVRVTRTNTPARARIARPATKPRLRPRAAAKAKRRVGRGRVVRRVIAIALVVGIGGWLGITGIDTWQRVKDVSAHAETGKTSVLAALGAVTKGAYPEANAGFAQAEHAFGEARSALQGLRQPIPWVLHLWPGDPLNSATQLTIAGGHLARAGASLVPAATAFDGVSLTGIIPKEGTTQDAATKPHSLTGALAAAAPHVDKAIAEFQSAAGALAQVNPDVLPGSIREDVRMLTQTFAQLRPFLDTAPGITGALANILGDTTARRYILVFQNPNELRPTGGFMGQFALVKVQDGIVEILDIKSIYDADGQVRSRRAAPEGLKVVSETLSLRDANWWPGFDASAQAILEFFGETGDPRADGVIAINPSVITNLLALTGPLEVDDVGTVTPEDFVEQAQHEVDEKDPTHDERFFPGVTAALATHLFGTEDIGWMELLGILAQAVQRKDLQLYVGDAEGQQLAAALGAAGKLPVGLDLVALVEANVGGGKTDAFITEERTLTLSVAPDKVRHQLDVLRTDTRTTEYKGQVNRTYVRAYVPRDATLIEAEGFDTDLKELLAYQCDDCTSDAATSEQAWGGRRGVTTAVEGDWLVIGGWVTLEAGESATLNLTYDVPHTRGDTLSTYVWRQPGTNNIPLKVHVQSSADAHVVGVHAWGETHQGLASLETILDADRIIGVATE